MRFRPCSIRCKNWMLSKSQADVNANFYELASVAFKTKLLLSTSRARFNFSNILSVVFVHANVLSDLL